MDVSPDSEQSQLELVIQARRAAARGEWKEAERNLVAARDHRLDNPIVLAWLAWVRVNRLADQAGKADRREILAWVDLATTIAPHDPDILRLAGLVRQRISSLS